MCDRERCKEYLARASTGPSLNLGNRFVLLHFGSDKNTKLCVWKFLQLLRMQMNGWKGGGKFSFVQYRYASPPRDNVDRVLRCGSLCWRTDDNLDYTLAERGWCAGKQLLSAGKWLKAEPICSFRCNILAVRKTFL